MEPDVTRMEPGVPRVELEGRDPAYGEPTDEDADNGSAVDLDVDIEVPAADWQPISSRSSLRPPSIAFIDGVRRIDANAWLHEGDASPPRRGMLASYAAGAVSVGSSAAVGPVEVRRKLFAPGNPRPCAPAVGEYRPVGTVDGGSNALGNALNEALGALEIEVATTLANAPSLIVVDGPLYGRQHLRQAVGYIKTHRVRYLSGLAEQTVAALKPGERTPVFRFRTSWTRHSWYMRLPGPVAHAWSGIVRLEAPDTLAVADCIALADLTSQALPRFASERHKDPRAPQNLYPIGGLERQLRHRLGDARFVERALRVAASTSTRE